MVVRHGTEQEAAQQLLHLHPLIELFRETCLSEVAPRAQPGSVLWHDDLATAPDAISLEAWWAILHAMEHVTVAYDITVRPSNTQQPVVVTYALAAFPLLRAALENALRAGWLLGAVSRRERVARRLRLVLTDACNFDESVRLVPGATQPPAREPTLQRLTSIASVADVSMTQLKKRVMPSEIVRDGAEALDTGSANALVFNWRTLSALTHGDRWAIRNFLDHDVVSGPDDEHVALVGASSSVDLIATHMGTCARWTQEALGLYVRQADEPEGRRPVT